MVNKKGGKAYKKGKNQTNVPDFTECDMDQMYGRVLKILGNCRLIIYCNDDERRICHIRGAIRKRVWIDTGDIVVVSMREFDSSVSAAEGLEKGDVLSKVDPHHYAKLKKDPVFNKKLMCELEKVEFDSNSSAHGLKIRAMMAAAESGGGGGSDDGGDDRNDTQTAARNNSEVVNEMFGNVGFEFDRGGEDEDEDEDGSGDEAEEGGAAGDAAGDGTSATPNYAARHKLQTVKRNVQRTAKVLTSADIDNI